MRLAVLPRTHEHYSRDDGGSDQDDNGCRHADAGRIPNAYEQDSGDHRHSERHHDQSTGTPRGGVIATDLAQKPRLTSIGFSCSIRDAPYVEKECGSQQRVEHQEDNQTYGGAHLYGLVCLRQFPNEPAKTTLRSLIS